MSKGINLIFFIWFVVNCKSLTCQNFEWLKGYGSKSGFENIIDLETDKSGNSIYLLNAAERTSLTFIDSIQLDSIKVFLPSGKQSKSLFLVKSDKNGKVIQLKNIGNFQASNIEIDEIGNIYVSGILVDTSFLIVNGKKLDMGNGHLIVLKLDQNFNQIWLFQDGVDSLIYYNGSQSYMNLVAYKNRKLLFNYNALIKTKFGSTTYNPITMSPLYGEINSLNGNLIWTKSLLSTNSQIEIAISNIISVGNCIYLTGNCRNSAQKGSYTIIYSDTFFGRESFVIKLDSVGAFIKKNRLYNGKTIVISSLASDQKNIYLGGHFVDTLKWGSQIIAPEINDYPTNLSYGSGKYLQFFVASLSLNLTPRWFYRPQVNGKSISSNYSGNVSKIYCNNDFIYAGVIQGGNSKINGIQIPDELGVLILKMDQLGNVLWYAKGGKMNINGIQVAIGAFDGKFVYIGGPFIDSTKFGILSILNKGIGSGQADAFITKLSDNAIIRGQVKAGPYCAGDTLRIPYRKIGDYDTSNVFIAELSDADGNFTGGHRQLGRLKSNKDSVILARLPLFQVGSSEKYRIRILSTAPAVQSYYKVDTLRLLIYSKDKAFAGNDTTICNGDSVNLQTFGGTKWNWSPSFKLKDSTARKTPAWPDKTTRYKIIIADSSGCGMADTAFKTIVVRKLPSIQFHTPKDTGVCIGGRMPLIASFHGGDSLGYTWQWASIDGLGNYSFPRSGSGKLADTLLYTMPVNELDSMRFVLYLNDACTPKTAFYNYTLKVKKQKSRARFNGLDTMVCPGKAIAVVAGFDAGDYSLYSWTWQEQNLSGSWNNRRFGSNKGADTFKYTLSPLWQGKKNLRVLLKDQCTGLGDTAVYSLIPRDTLSLSLNSGDTTLCQANQYVFKVKAKGGNPSTYQYRWINTNSQDTLSLTDSLLYKPKIPAALMVEVSDGCMQKSIQKTIQVDVFPVLSADIYSQSKKAKDSTLCYGQVLKVYAQSSGGKGSGYTYLWKYNGVNIGQKDSIAFTPSQTAVLELIGSDACFEKDSSRINITVLPKLESNIKTQDSLCLPSAISLKALAQGGKGNYSYQWLSSSNVLLGSKDSLQINYNDSSQKGLRVYKLILQDGCSSNDSTKINLHLLPGLSLALKTQDTCISSSTVLTALASGGKANKQQITWFKNGVFLSSGPSSSLNIAAQSARYSAVLNDGCSKASDTASIRVYTKAQVSIKVSNPCYGDTSILKARLLSSNPISNYNWLIDNNNLSTIDSVLKLRFNSIGLHTIVLKAGTGQCVGKDSISFTIIEKPKAAFDFNHLPNTNTGIPFQFNDRSLLANSWAWTFGTYGQASTKNPKFTFPDSGFIRIKLRVGKQNLCFDSTEQNIPIYERIEFYFPDAISIDGNGINDAFGLNPGQYPFVKTYRLSIFNRWGEKVFNSDVKEETFSSSGALQGVYVYKVFIKDIYDITHTLEGTLTVLK